MNTLDILYTARATLSDEAIEFKFSHWGACTCGHIYGAEIGEIPSTEGYSPEIMEAMDGSEAIREVAELLGFNNQPGLSSYPECFISNLTVDNIGGGGAELCRKAGLDLVNEAIEKLEVRYEQDRLRVTKWAEEIKNEVESEEYVVA